MKICPRCQKTYADDNLNFCLEDGSVLAQASSAPPSYSQQIPPTNPQLSMPSQAGQAQWNTAGHPQDPQNYAMQGPKKSSKAWVWVLLILGAVILLCGGGVIGLVYYAGQQANQFANTVANIANNANISTNRSTTTTRSNSNSNSNLTGSSRSNVEKVDLSAWVAEPGPSGSAESSGDELIVTAKKKNFYYVVSGPDRDEMRTDDADTVVTVRNVGDAPSTLGYGLVFHSNPILPLLKDYAFLIDTKTKRFRVVHHVPGDEKVDVQWTPSPAIKGGTEENILEVHDLSDKVELYINGTMVKSITNTYGYAGGVPGLYSADGIRVAFKNLEVRR